MWLCETKCQIITPHTKWESLKNVGIIRGRGLSQHTIGNTENLYLGLEQTVLLNVFRGRIRLPAASYLATWGSSEHDGYAFEPQTWTSRDNSGSGFVTFPVRLSYRDWIRVFTVLTERIRKPAINQDQCLCIAHRSEPCDWEGSETKLKGKTRQRENSFSPGTHGGNKAIWKRNLEAFNQISDWEIKGSYAQRERRNSTMKMSAEVSNGELWPR